MRIINILTKENSMGKHSNMDEYTQKILLMLASMTIDEKKRVYRYVCKLFIRK